MTGLRLAALCAVASLSAGAARADLIQLHWAGSFDGFTDTLGLISPAGTVFAPAPDSFVTFDYTLVYDTRGLPADTVGSYTAPVRLGSFTIEGFIPATGIGGARTLHPSSSASLSILREDGGATFTYGGGGAGNPPAFFLSVSWPGPFTVNAPNSLPASGPPLGLLTTLAPTSTPFISALSLTNLGPSPAPDAPTWALLIGGFGLAGTALRRRRARLV